MDLSVSSVQIFDCRSEPRLIFGRIEGVEAEVKGNAVTPYSLLEKHGGCRCHIEPQVVKQRFGFLFQRIVYANIDVGHIIISLCI